MHILVDIILVLFWSAVLAFVPTTFYLLIKNPPLYKADQVISKGIFIISQESWIKKAKRSRVRVVLMIYVLCVVFFSGAYIFNRQQQVEGVKPFDVLSTISVALFWFSVLSYLPVGLYLFLKNPWQYREEGVCLTAIYFIYGVGILILSLIFSFFWLQSNHLLVNAGDVLSSLAIILFGSLVLSYLPILVYVFFMAASFYKKRQFHFNTIFVIYSICFLFFSTLYIVNWTSDRRAGIKYDSVADYFRVWNKL